MTKKVTVEEETGEIIDDPLPCVTTGIALVDDNIPDGYRLGNNYPNPFNPSTRIEYSIPQAVYYYSWHFLDRNITTG